MLKDEERFVVKRNDKMLTKKMLCFVLGIGIGVGITYLYGNSASVDQKIKCLKRKLNKLEKDMEKALDKLKPDQLQKYKNEFENKYKEIMTKVDNLTIKDIKNKTSNALSTIKENIKNLSSKISSITMDNNS